MYVYSARARIKYTSAFRAEHEEEEGGGLEPYTYIFVSELQKEEDKRDKKKKKKRLLVNPFEK